MSMGKVQPLADEEKKRKAGQEKINRNCIVSVQITGNDSISEKTRHVKEPKKIPPGAEYSSGQEYQVNRGAC